MVSSEMSAQRMVLATYFALKRPIFKGLKALGRLALKPQNMLLINIRDYYPCKSMEISKLREFRVGKGLL